MHCGNKKYYTEEVLDKLANSLYTYMLEGRAKDEVRYLHDWAIDNKFSNKNFARYAAQHEGFKEAYETFKYWQEGQVIKNALTKKFDSGFSQFLLRCRFGWKTEEDNDTKANKVKSALEKISNMLSGEKEEEED